MVRIHGDVTIVIWVVTVRAKKLESAFDPQKALTQLVYAASCQHIFASELPAISAVQFTIVTVIRHCLATMSGGDLGIRFRR